MWLGCVKMWPQQIKVGMVWTPKRYRWMPFWMLCLTMSRCGQMHANAA